MAQGGEAAAGDGVRAEVFAVRVTADGAVWCKPDELATWCVPVDPRVDPFDTVRDVVTADLGTPVVLHSTSWRHEDGSVVLTFLAVVEHERACGGMRWVPVRRAALARGRPDDPPDELASTQVLEHAMRHLAWLAADDPQIAGALPDDWLVVLRAYEPAPFRHIDELS